MKPQICSILNAVARKHGISPRQVREEIRFAIAAGYASPDPAIRAAWKRLGFHHCPDPEEFLTALFRSCEAEQ